MSTHRFLLGHTQTMGHVWSAWGPNSEEGQMVPGIEGRTRINITKEWNSREGGQVPSLLFSPSGEIREGVIHLQSLWYWKPIKSMMSLNRGLHQL